VSFAPSALLTCVGRGAALAVFNQLSTIIADRCSSRRGEFESSRVSVL